MKTDDLIAALAADTAPEPPLRRRLPWMVGPALAVTLLAALLLLGPRPDLARALVSPLGMLKTLAPMAVAAAAAVLMLRLAHPLPGLVAAGGAGGQAAASGAGQGLRMVFAGVALMLLAAVVWTLATHPPAAWPALLIGETVFACLVSIPALSLLLLAAALAVVRAGAPLRLRAAGAAAGFLAGALATTVYSLHCTEDSPLFYTMWYGSGIAVVTALGALLAPRVLRW